MSSVTALDNQIRKKKRAIREAKDRLQTLEAQRAQLSEEYRERSENYERIKERVRHAGEEIRIKSAVIEDLREQLRIKQGGGLIVLTLYLVLFEQCTSCLLMISHFKRMLKNRD